MEDIWKLDSIHFLPAPILFHQFFNLRVMKPSIYGIPKPHTTITYLNLLLEFRGLQSHIRVGTRFDCLVLQGLLPALQGCKYVMGLRYPLLGVVHIVHLTILTIQLHIHFFQRYCFCYNPACSLLIFTLNPPKDAVISYLCDYPIFLFCFPRQCYRIADSVFN